MDDEEEKSFGCDHYKRKCALISPCCSKQYTCRVCHDDKENHELNRKKVQEIVCLKCCARQGVNQKCTNCDVLFGKYFCEVCRLFDDVDKKQFHCEPCGLCRVGGRENFFHCPKCDLCLSVSMKEKHKCIEKSSHSNCPVCLNNLHTSRMEAHIPPCGHLIHHECMNQCLKTGNYACPTCGQSMVDMKRMWEQLDNEMTQVEMPDEYKNFKVQILCKDCHKESRVNFHVVGLKCQHCGSYNTCRAAEPEGAQSLPDDGEQCMTTGQNNEMRGEERPTSGPYNEMADERQTTGPFNEMSQEQSENSDP